MNRTIKPLLLLSLVVSACSDNTMPSSTNPIATSASPSFSLSPQVSGRPIAGRYIVGFKNNVADVDREARRLELRHRGVLRMTYKSALKGMAHSRYQMLPADSLRNDPNVAFVEQDRTISTASRAGCGAGVGPRSESDQRRASPLNGMLLVRF